MLGTFATSAAHHAQLIRAPPLRCGVLRGSCGMLHGGLWHVTQGFWHGVVARRTGYVTLCCGMSRGGVFNVVWGVVVHPRAGSLKRRLTETNPKEEVAVGRGGRLSKFRV